MCVQHKLNHVEDIFTLLVIRRLNIHLRMEFWTLKERVQLVNAFGKTATGMLLPPPFVTTKKSWRSVLTVPAWGTSTFPAQPLSRSSRSPLPDSLPGSIRTLQAHSCGLTVSSFLNFGDCRHYSLCPHCYTDGSFMVTLLDLHPSSVASLVQGKPKLRRFLKSLIGMLPAQKVLPFYLLHGSPLQDVTPRHSCCLAYTSMERS